VHGHQNREEDQEKLDNAKEHFESHGALPPSLIEYLSHKAYLCCKDGWALDKIIINDDGDIQVIIVDTPS